MRTHIVRIGNSHGVRIPEALLDKTGLKGEVEITAEGDSVVIRPVKRPREGWATAFKEMARCGDDRLMDDVPTLSSWDKDEWEWR